MNYEYIRIFTVNTGFCNCSLSYNMYLSHTHTHVYHNHYITVSVPIYIYKYLYAIFINYTWRRSNDRKFVYLNIFICILLVNYCVREVSFTNTQSRVVYPAPQSIIGIFIRHLPITRWCKSVPGSRSHPQGESTQHRKQIYLPPLVQTSNDHPVTRKGRLPHTASNPNLPPAG